MPLPGTVPLPAPVPIEENPAVLGEKISDDGEGSSAAGLTDHEKAIIDRQLDAPDEKVGYFSLFRYANKKEALIMTVSFLASVAAGAAMPLMTVSTGVDPERACADLHFTACVW